MRGLERCGLKTEFFRQPNFRFVVDFFQATETGKGKAVDGDGADFADGRVFCRWTTAFFMNQDKHLGSLITNRKRSAALVSREQRTTDCVLWLNRFSGNPAC
jgi:hypothetical protein